MGIEYQQLMRTEVKADVYGGDNCNEISTHFETYCEGDMDSGTHTEDIVLRLSELPAGAKVSVEYPCCPECGMAREDKFEHLPGGRMKVIGHADKCDCDFDWVEWIRNQYS